MSYWNGKLWITRERGRMLAIKHQIDAGQYHVDSRRVADAILARALLARAAAQSACSNPESFVSASVNATPAGPATTDPTQVIPTLSPRPC